MDWIFALIINQLQNLIWVPLWGHVGLALSISITACIQCIVLYMLLWRQGDVKPNRALGMFLLKMMMALIVLGLFIYWFNPSMVWWEEATSLQQAVRLAFIVFWGGGAYGLMWWIMGMRPKDFSFRV